MKLTMLTADRLEVVFFSVTENIRTTITRKRWDEMGNPMSFTLAMHPDE